MAFHTPILLITWKRPKETLRVIKALSIIKPSKIYISSDGARLNHKDEFKKVNDTREIVEKYINWNANIKTLYHKKNNGCMRGVSIAINWFFDNEDEGIILEDDCVPHPDFFPFCEELLQKYRDDKRIWCITGNNLQGNKWIGKSSYYFSRYNHCWGWASWKRCWSNYDVLMKDWPNFYKSGLFESLFFHKKELKHWKSTFDSIYYFGKPDTWDYQWTYTCFINSGLTAIPNKNLIENIGFNEEGTHTKKGNSPAILENHEKGKSGILPLSHPEYIIRSEDADRYTELMYFSGPNRFSLLYLFKLFKRIFNRLKIIRSSLKG